MRTHPVIRAIELSHTACIYDVFRQNRRSHRRGVIFCFNNIVYNIDASRAFLYIRDERRKGLRSCGDKISGMCRRGVCACGGRISCLSDPGSEL